MWIAFFGTHELSFYTYVKGGKKPYNHLQKQHFFIVWGYRHILGVETVYYGIICLLIYLNKELYVDNVHVFISNFVCNISLQNILVNIMTLNFSPRFM